MKNDEKRNKEISISQYLFSKYNVLNNVNNYCDN